MLGRHCCEARYHIEMTPPHVPLRLRALPFPFLIPQRIDHVQSFTEVCRLSSWFMMVVILWDLYWLHCYPFFKPRWGVEPPHLPLARRYEDASFSPAVVNCMPWKSGLLVTPGRRRAAGWSG